MLLLWVLGFAALSAADITIKVADVTNLPLDAAGSVTSPNELFRRSCPEEFSKDNPYKPEILVSSHAEFGAQNDNVFEEGSVFPSSDSFIRGALEAWAKHQHLVLRPDEVWFTILSQLNFYMPRNAESLRDLFVSHKEKKTIQVAAFTWRDVVAAFSSEIQDRVKTPWLREWILPGFSTSTEDDEVTATVLMMGLMQNYFNYEGMMVCGLPAVTLLGTREDWVSLLAKLDRLPEWGAEPASYARNLRPILERFVRSWDEPESEDVKAFWRLIVRANKHWSCGSGPFEYGISGWITGFLHWTVDGKPRIAAPVEDDEDDSPPPTGDVTLDNVSYVSEALNEIPVGYARAPLKMLDYPIAGVDTEAYLLAGNIGVRREEEEEEEEEDGGGGGGGGVRARAMSAWFLYAPVKFGGEVSPWRGSFEELERVVEGVVWCRDSEGEGREVGEL